MTPYLIIINKKETLKYSSYYTEYVTGAQWHELLERLSSFYCKDSMKVYADNIRSWWAI